MEDMDTDDDFFLLHTVDEKAAAVVDTCVVVVVDVLVSVVVVVGLEIRSVNVREFVLRVVRSMMEYESQYCDVWKFVPCIY